MICSSSSWVAPIAEEYVGAKFKCSITLLLRKMLAVTVGCQEADLLGRLRPGGRWTYEPREVSPFCYINDDGNASMMLLLLSSRLLVINDVYMPCPCLLLLFLLACLACSTGLLLMCPQSLFFLPQIEFQSKYVNVFWNRHLVYKNKTYVEYIL